MKNLKQNKNSLIYMLIFIVVLFSFCACSNLDKSAAHISYADNNNSIKSEYGKGNYLYSTVTFTGTAMNGETICSVKEIEEKALNTDTNLGYEGKYSLLTSGSKFSQHKYTGIKLYDLLISLGMDKNINDKTNITVISTDGYTKVFSVSELKNSKYNCYESMSGKEAKEENLPVILSFGCDGVPLVGPTGNQKIGTTMEEKDGYDADADNIGGPVRLTLGQTDSSNYNAPDNEKWVTKVIVGDEKDYTIHSGTEAKKKVLTLSSYDSDKKNKKIDSVKTSVGDVEKIGKKNIERNYYGNTHFFEGTNLWAFLKNKLNMASQEGKAKFTFADGSTETVTLEYLRNLKSENSKYISVKNGKNITNVMPALGYGIDGTPSKDGKIYALLSSKKGEKNNTTVKECIAIDVYTTKSTSANPNKNSSIVIDGKGITKKTTYTVEDMEDFPVMIETLNNGYSGVNLYALLDKTGLTVDAEKVEIDNGNKTIELKLSDLKKGDYILATRKNGNGLTKSDGDVSLQGKQTLRDAKNITVKIKSGQWTHNKGTYKQYLDNKITISGSEVKSKKSYTLKDLENLGEQYEVRNSFGASAGTKGYQGVVLKEIVEDNLKSGLKKPTKITVIGKDGYKKEILVKDVYAGIDSKYQAGEHRDIILAYSVNGTPLVPSKKSDGYNGTNAFGPVRLVVENQVSGWVKNVVEIKLGK